MGSVTKQFTAAAILQLQDAGKLKLDDPVNAYLPRYAFDPNLSLRMLLNQTSGLPDYVEFAAAPSWTGGAAQASILAAISHAPSLFVAGSAYTYSNSNYFILGAIIEHVSGRSYADYLAQHILLPLGLANTSYLNPTATAMPYTYTRPLLPGAQGLAPGIVPDSSYLFAAGALWTTAEDLNKWDAALLNGEVIPAALFAMAVMPPATVPVFQQAPTASPYAMGWIRNSLAGHPFVWHNGKTYAYTAFNGMFLDDGFSVSVLTNVDIQEDTPLLAFSTKLIQAVCAASPASC
ncbi:hypothetical protein GCM10011396_35140 [Undibacterium terreum]|uniref:Beta-lactamase-related domain-containing protein n=2 Tax=Undibacterium terreum TaxID=1224302 RepID=A0A916URI6_9BURK|nr:hypothetical protein GCM10011396_35140 [Undibacterium terreum]